MNYSMARGKKTTPKRKGKRSKSGSPTRKTRKGQTSKRAARSVSSNKARAKISKSTSKRKTSVSKRAKVVAVANSSSRSHRGKRSVKPQANQLQQQSLEQKLAVVRIMGQGQYQLDSETISKLNEIDNSIVKLIEESEKPQEETSGIEEKLREKLSQMASLITNNGKEIDSQEIIASDFIVPPADSSIEEVRTLFEGEGLIPG